MKIGLVSAILDGWDYDEMLAAVAEIGYQCVEIACWPQGTAERRYAGVSHLDIDRILKDGEYRREVLEKAEAKGIEISALAYYPNTMDGDLEVRKNSIRHLKKVIEASALLGINLVTTFIGRDQTKTVEENLELFKTIWPPIIRLAEQRGVRIAIENCPMLFDRSQWPGGQNLMTSPVIWRQLFELLPSKNFGLNFDPSHFVWQGMDYIHPIYEFSDRIFHVHFKDIKMLPDKLAECGVMAYPLDYMKPKLPGLGDVNWAKFVSALTDVGFDGCACVEVEDRAFEGSRERILRSLELSRKYMDQFVI